MGLRVCPLTFLGPGFSSNRLSVLLFHPDFVHVCACVCVSEHVCVCLSVRGSVYVYKCVYVLSVCLSLNERVSEGVCVCVWMCA